MIKRGNLKYAGSRSAIKLSLGKREVKIRGEERREGEMRSRNDMRRKFREKIFESLFLCNMFLLVLLWLWFLGPCRGPPPHSEQF